jgi:hypothetical protein
MAVPVALAVLLLRMTDTGVVVQNVQWLLLQRGGSWRAGRCTSPGRESDVSGAAAAS